MAHRLIYFGTNFLIIKVGLGHLVHFTFPKGIKVTRLTKQRFIIEGEDRDKVLELRRQLRDYKRWEIYKGKGIRFREEKLILKQKKENS